MDLIFEIIVSALLVISGIFGFVGSYGLVKLPEPMTRLHAPTKAATLGVGAVLIASMIHFAWFGGRVSWHELLITVFVFLTAPVTGLMIAKANIHLQWDKEELPPTGTGTNWATQSDRPSIMDDGADSRLKHEGD
ncbi:multicomponent K+:H+ antiporter subunit G [Paracoccus isoporae]|uniref:Multicomponent K+:H+ antiporter subunit G n=1 Tax=Paracoccus isoporae TaxID=591205 RepID=A0A1G6UG44_9RHOB|nr:Na+/H+ antiporter subunit G [Paracoccus isoporae]SDD40229.1 multicomponent K+:H+ antiporter subunit G [Paracoccus isoporae]